MKLASLLSLSIAFPCFADTVHWEFSENTNGNDVHWVSPTSVDPNADQFEYQYEITYVGVDVVFLGQIIGPEDVTDQIDPELLFGFGIVDGPTPIVMMDEPLEADADSDGEIDVAADIFMQIDGNGFGQFDVTNVFLGDVMVDMGWPLGWQNVEIDRIYMDGYMDVTPLSNPCPQDVNGDSIIDVEDVLATIGNWGNAGEGDVNGDGIVDVTDLLEIVAAWGPC
ncbi:MAG: hypothetical protein QGI78_00745 [Phycisphaerales bacterium]|nr:hypothetical protein [Phycisphaerales bacterium]